MANEYTLRKLLKCFFQAGQTGFVDIAFVVQVKQEGQTNFSASLVEFHTSRMVKRHSRFVLAKASRPRLDIVLQRIDNRLLVASEGSPRIDRTEGDQSVAERLCLFQDESAAPWVARRLGRNQ